MRCSLPLLKRKWTNPTEKIVKTSLPYVIIIAACLFASCSENTKKFAMEVYETSAGGNQLTLLTDFELQHNASLLKILPEKQFQTQRPAGYFLH